MLILKQCTKLLPKDTSIYTVYAVFAVDSEGIEEIDTKNDHVSKEMKVYLDGNSVVHDDYKVIKSFATAMKDTSLLLCADGTETSASILRAIVDILAKNDVEPLVIETRKDIDAPFWEMALQYNHTVSSNAHGGFGGGLTSPVEYEAVKDIISKEIYDRYVMSCCIDDRHLPPFWTPYSPDQDEELELGKNIEKDDIFKIEIMSPPFLNRKREFNEHNTKKYIKGLK